MPTRVTGLATGMDIDSLVKTTMQAYQSKIDIQTQKKDVLEIKQKLYRDVITDGQNFYKKYFDLAKSDSLLYSKNFATTKFDSSDSMVATATGLSTAVKDNYKVNVTQIAEGAKKTYTNAELQGDIEIKSGGKSVFIKDSDIAGKTDKEKATIINSKISSLGLKATISDFKSGITIETKVTGKSATFSVNLGGTAIDETVNGTTITDLDSKSYNVSDLLSGTQEDLMFSANGKNAIIKASDLKTAVKSVQDKIDALDLADPEYSTKLDTLEKEKANVVNSTLNSKLKSFGINAKVSDDSISINIEPETSGEKFSITSGTYNAAYTSGGTENSYEGKNLHATITNSQGSVVYDETNVSTSNAPTLDGVQFNITDVGESKLVGKTDSKDSKEKIVNFINDYNTLMEKLNKLTLDTRDRSYSPLTKSQKEEMSEDEIKLWNEKVEKGQLGRDNDLRRIVNNLKNAISSSVIGLGSTLEGIGIEPMKDYSTKNGMFTINEDKLTQALESDSEAVMNIFLQKPTDTTGMTESEINSKTGIMYRLKDILNNEFVSSTKSSLIQKAGLEGTVFLNENPLSKQINEYEKKIKEMNSLFSDKEQALYSKYAKLETAMNTYNTQLSNMASYFGTNS